MDGDRTASSDRTTSGDRDGPLRIAIVNDYELVVEGLRAMLEPYRDRVVVVETEARGTPDHCADIVLFDTFASRRTSLHRIDQMGRDAGLGRIVLYTWDLSDGFVADVDRAHVDGVILKSQRGAQLVDALERVARGEPVGCELLDDPSTDPGLTERELEVLALLARGMSNRQIADELYLSVETVKTHARTLFRKLGVDNRTRAALVAPRYGVDDPTRRIA